MKSLLKVSGKKKSFVKNESDQKWTFEQRPGGWIIATRGNERRRVFWDRQGQKVWGKISGFDFYGEKLPEARQGSQASSGQDFVAQFPGKVRKVMVSEGDTVEAGTSILMIEAMKMEFAMKAESKGQVVKILVKEGDQLSPGQKLLDFKEMKE